MRDEFGCGAGDDVRASGVTHFRRSWEMRRVGTSQMLQLGGQTRIPNRYCKARPAAI